MFVGVHVSNTKCKINDKELDVVKSFEYLGRVLSNNGNDTKAVENRISKGWAAFQKFGSVISSRHVSMTNKKKHFETSSSVYCMAVRRLYGERNL